MLNDRESKSDAPSVDPPNCSWYATGVVSMLYVSPVINSLFGFGTDASYIIIFLSASASLLEYVGSLFLQTSVVHQFGLSEFICWPSVSVNSCEYMAISAHFA